MKLSLLLINEYAELEFQSIAFITLCALAFAGLVYLIYQYIALLSTGRQDEKPFRSAFKYAAVSVFVFAFIVRIILAYAYYGHGDVSYFAYFVRELTGKGTGSFYDTLFYEGEMGLNNYLPGYLVVLRLVGMAAEGFNISYSSQLFVVLLKLPAIICDIASGFAIYLIAKKYLKRGIALSFSVLYLFNPAVFLNSALWGQMDSLTALLTLLTLYFLLQKKYLPMTAALAVGVITKIQFAFALPVIGTVLLCDVFKIIKGKRYKELYKRLLCIPLFIAVIFAVSLPFTYKYLSEQPFFIFKTYTGQIDYYNYYNLNSFNLYGLMGENWQALPSANFLGSISYDALNYLIIAAVSIAAAALYACCKARKNIFLLAAYCIIAVFTFALKMHERYVFAALLPLAIACIVFVRDKRIWFIYTGFSLLHFLNVGILLFSETRYFYPTEPVMIIGSFLWVALFVYFTYVVLDIVLFKSAKNSDGVPENIINNQSGTGQIVTENLLNESTAAQIGTDEEASAAKNQAVLKESIHAAPDEIVSEYADNASSKKSAKTFDDRYNSLIESRQKTRLKKRDYIVMTVAAVVFFLINLINLGSTNVPQTIWGVQGSADNPEYVVVELVDSGAVIGKIWGYKSIDAHEDTNNSVKVYAANDIENGDFSGIISPQNYKLKRTVSSGGGDGSAQMYKWFTAGELNNAYRYVAFLCADNGVRINELVLTEKDTGKILDYSVVYLSREGALSPANAADESGTFPGYNSLMTDMYFDEIYHARTAFEHINDWRPYETTHPPLGKIIISIGIRIFGMNPFGWRIMGVMFSAMLLPVIYMLGKQLFKSSKWAAVLMLLFSLDGLHFVQGRIATIDTYIVFFSALAMLFMIRFFKTNILREKVSRCLAQLALAGVFFGLAVACKWTGVYTGVGMFILLLIYFARMLDEYRYKAGELSGDNAQDTEQIDKKTAGQIDDGQYILQDDKNYTEQDTAQNIKIDNVKNTVHDAKTDAAHGAADRETDGGELAKYSRALDLKLAYILITCIIFFIVIPFCIYLLSYLPYMIKGSSLLNVEGETRSLLQVMFDNQSSMLYYHGEWVVDKPHTSASKWWTWPLNYRSVYFYAADSSFGADMYARIHSLLNPAISVAGVISLFAAAYMLFIPRDINNQNPPTMEMREKEPEKLSGRAGENKQCDKTCGSLSKRKYMLTECDRETFMLLFIGFLSAYLPWALVERTTFIYHFYPAMPYFCGIIVFVMAKLCKRYSAGISLNLSAIIYKTPFAPLKNMYKCGERNSGYYLLKIIPVKSQTLCVTKGKIICAAVIAAAIVMFAMLFPLYTGIPVSDAAANFLFRWLKGFGDHYGL